ncbi:hypothetical protein [Fictibacillus terranigra]|uniref:Uncharacterized protein n=1 Tax=Fictibacillus terranigra TaxID=3058424 RepID=A0ABT8ED18_9BACL|nr:hypothetical protein [Fictibacillus sp. CENA-BCM004]MDN4075833.1 hypothetical protein [Fictibacillus sp. CENA-BCM004]
MDKTSGSGSGAFILLRFVDKKQIPFPFSPVAGFILAIYGALGEGS